MKKLKKSELPLVPAVMVDNTIKDIHTRFMDLVIKFREKVCLECNYSTPTYYRKAKGEEKKISKAEREQIRIVERECIEALMTSAGMRKADSPGEAA